MAAWDINGDVQERNIKTWKMPADRNVQFMRQAGVKKARAKKQMQKEFVA